MEKRQLGGALLIFIAAFLTTQQLMSKKDWTVNRYAILGCCAVLLAVGIYAAVSPGKKS